MKTLAGQTAILTGASGGLGTFMTHALAEAGMNLALIAYPGIGLEDLKRAVESRGQRAITLVADLRNPSQYRYIIEEVNKAFGNIDVLVNNAGVEVTAQYHQQTVESINDIITVNLTAPMMLTWLVLPEMLRRKRGHIVNISSLAGKAAPAFQEPYAATKAGLIAFTTSLRATYRGSGVSASVVTPGFVEAGIYARLKEKSGQSAPVLLGTSSPHAVARAVLRAIQKDLPEVIINRFPVRPLFALNALSPSLGAWIIDKIGSNDFFRRALEAQSKKQA